MKVLAPGLTIILTTSCLLAPKLAEASWFLAGQASPQNNSWAGKNEGPEPPVSYNSYEAGFYGAWWTYTTADRGTLYNQTGTSKGVPWNFVGYAQSRFDDLVFTCADGRSQVTYRARVILSAEVAQDAGDGVGPAALAIGDPTCAWGSCASNWGGWTSTGGGTGPLAGFPAGTGFPKTVITGPSRTVSTGVFRTFSLSIRTSANPYGNPGGYRGLRITTNAILPTNGPVFDLPEGCTCNSEEMGLIGNRLVPFGFIRAEPPYGGDDGIVTVIVIGNGFEDGSEVRLTGLGPDIPGLQPTVNDKGTRITARFDLRGAVHGAWDITVENPGGMSVTGSEAFQVEPGRPPRLAVSLSAGRTSRIRINDLSTFTVHVTNLGNTDALFVPLRVSGVPEGAQWIPDFQSASLGPPIPGLPPVLPGSVSVDGTMQMPLLIPRIPPGFTTNVTSRVKVSDLQGFTFKAIASPPQLPSTAINPALAGNRALTSRLQADPTCAPDGECSYGAPADFLQCLDDLFPGIESSCAAALFSDMTQDLNDVMCELVNGGGGGGAGAGAGAPASPVNQVEGMIYEFCSVLPPMDCYAGPLPDVDDVLDVLSCLYALRSPDGDGTECCTSPSGCETGDSTDVRVVTSFDPNEKSGMTTLSSQGYIQPTLPIAYRIDFENLPSATAAARRVEVMDNLPTALNAASIRWDAIRIGNRVLYPDPFEPALRETLDLRPDADLLVAIQGDVSGRGLAWAFEALDPATKEPPSDPLTGFLPPNVTPPEGEGGVSVLIAPHGGLSTGTLVENTASIVFDSNPPIETGAVVHRIDADAPVSVIEALSPETADPTIPLTAIGADAGAGILDYLIYVSEDEGPYAIAGRAGPSGTFSFVGQPGHHYAFYSVARDSAANVESAPDGPDAETFLTGGTPVLLSLFDVVSVADGVEIRWILTDDAGVASIVIQSAPTPEGPWADRILESRLEGHQNIALDPTMQMGETRWFRLQFLLRGGSVEYSGSVRVTRTPPESVFALRILDRTPTSGDIRVEFELPTSGAVDLRVFDISGREVGLLAHGMYSPGRWQATWRSEGNGRPTPSGLYFVRLEASGRFLVRKFVLLR